MTCIGRCAELCDQKCADQEGLLSHEGVKLGAERGRPSCICKLIESTSCRTHHSCLRKDFSTPRRCVSYLECQESRTAYIFELACSMDRNPVEGSRLDVDFRHQFILGVESHESGLAHEELQFNWYVGVLPAKKPKSKVNSILLKLFRKKRHVFPNPEIKVATTISGLELSRTVLILG